jgi:DNA sulfur modification protein DndC
MQQYKQLDVFRHTDPGKAMLSTLQEAQDLTIQSLQAYGADRNTWVVGFSGGKDSTATATFIDWAIAQGRIQRPENLILVYSDTLMELPSLETSAHGLIDHLQRRGWQVRRSEPALETKPTQTERFFVTMLGRGYPPPHNRFRWCTDRMKTAKIDLIYGAISEEYGADFLGIDGIRKGESAARDKLITSSCATDEGECGQGWFHNTPAGAKLSPILHWRVCHVWDWIVEAYFEHGYPIGGVIETYGVDITDDGVDEPLSARTGCIGCPLVTTPNEKRPRPDKALATVVEQEAWSHLTPFQQLSEIYWRLRWDESFRHRKLKPKKKNKVKSSDQLTLWADGGHLISQSEYEEVTEKGCLTLAAREWALGEILALQDESARLALEKGRTPYTLIQAEEVALIRQMIADRTFPDPRRYAPEELAIVP